MKRLLAIIIAVSLALIPYSFVSARDSKGSAPPVEQPLVREGDFAVKLANTLNLTKSTDEAEAETSLASAGIAPKNGWISDYPMTPDIISEVEESVGGAADAGKLAFSRSDALRLVDNVSTEMNLHISVAGEQNNYNSDQYASSSGSDYLPQETVDNYYYDYGPPVVSYYPPPWDYWYLYSWVPLAFWWGGWGFGGYYILNNFCRVVAFHHGGTFGTRQVSNFATSTRNGVTTTRAIDPATRTTTTAGSRLGGPTSTGTGWNRTSGSTAGFANANARQGASSILNRSLASANTRTGTATAGASTRQSGSIAGSSGRSAGSSFSRNAGGSAGTASRASRSNFAARSSGAGTFRSSPSSSGFRGGMSSGGFRGGSFGGLHASAGGGSFGGFHGGGGGGFHGGGGGHR